MWLNLIVHDDLSVWERLFGFNNDEIQYIKY